MNVYNKYLGNLRINRIETHLIEKVKDIGNVLDKQIK